jgi:hypothetical protein
MPSVRPSSFSLFLSPLLYPFSMCFPRQCRKARESLSLSLNLYIRCERSDRPTTPFGQPTNPFPFYSLDDDPDFYIYFCCVCFSLIIFSIAPFQLAPPSSPQRSGVGGHSLLSLSIYIQLTPPGPLSCSAAFCVSSMPK